MFLWPGAASGKAFGEGTRLSDSIQKAAILYDASQAALSGAGLDEVLNHILTIIRDHFQIVSGSVLVFDKTQQDLYVGAHLGSGGWKVGDRVPLDRDLVSDAVRLKRPAHLANPAEDPKKRREARSEVAIPLLVREEVVGVLDLHSHQAGYFQSE